MAKTTKSQARTKRERSEFLWGWLFIRKRPIRGCIEISGCCM